MKKRMQIKVGGIFFLMFFICAQLVYGEIIKIKPVSGQMEEYVKGKFGQGLHVIGSCFLNYSCTPQVFSYKEGTIATWFKLEDNCYYKVIFAEGEAGNKNCITLFISPTDARDKNCSTGIVRLSFVDKDGKERILLSKTKINLNIWYHVVVSFKEGVTKLYLNGVEENRTENIGPIEKAGPLLHIAANIGNGCTFRGGLLDEFIILDKTLEAGEVAELYMSEEPFKPTKNTKLYLNFDGTNEGISETLN